MKLSNLSICNFKGISKYEIASPVYLNAVLGANGAGKTSLLDAIRFLLTGKAPNHYVRDPDIPSYVQGEVEGIGFICRGTKKGTSFCMLNGKSCTQKALAEQISKTFEMSATTAGIATSSEVLREMFGGDFSQYLLTEGYMSLNIPKEEFDVMCNFHGLAKDLVEKELLTRNKTVKIQKVGIQDITYMHQVFKDYLKVYKKRLSELEAQIKAANSDEPNVSEDTAKKELKAAQEKLVAAKSAISTYKHQKEAYQEGLKKLEILNKQIASLTYSPVNIPLRQEKEKMVAEKRIQYASIKSSIKGLQDEINSMSGLIEKLNTPICPLSNKLVCTVDKSPIQNELQAKINEMKKQAHKLLDSLNAMETEGKNLAREVAAMLENEKAAQKAAQLTAQKKGIEETLLKPSEIKDETGPCEASYQEALSKLQKVEAYKTYCHLLKTKESTEEYIFAYKKIVAAFEPKGIIAETILTKAVDPLAEYCNELAEKMFQGKEIYFDVTNGLKVCLKQTLPETGESVIIPFEGCSTGEQFRILLIVMDMINQLSGYNILVLDNLDVLDTQAMQAVLEFLHDNGSYDHVFLAGIDKEEMKQVFEKVGVNFISLSEKAA